MLFLILMQLKKNIYLRLMKGLEDKKRAFFKKQIYELTEYYQYLKELKLSVCKKNYSLFELEEGFSPKKK